MAVTVQGRSFGIGAVLALLALVLAVVFGAIGKLDLIHAGLFVLLALAVLLA